MTKNDEYMTAIRKLLSASGGKGGTGGSVGRMAAKLIFFVGSETLLPQAADMLPPSKAYEMTSPVKI